MKPNKFRVIDFLDTLGGLVFVTIIDGSYDNILLEYYTSINCHRVYDDISEDILSKEVTEVIFEDNSIYLDVRDF